MDCRGSCAYHRGGNPALRIAGVASAGVRLGEDDDAAMRGKFKRRPQTRDAAADDEVVGQETSVHGGLLS